MKKKYPEPVKRGDSSSYFFWFTESNGKRRRVSTGKGKGQKEQARQFIRDYIDRKESGLSKTFREYSSKFFVWEECPRVARLLDEGKSIGKSHVSKSRRWLEKYVFPDTIFSEIPINEIKRGDILDFRKRLQKISPGENTINKVVATIKTVLSEAAYRQDISYNPGSQVGEIKYEQRERAKLELNEVRELLSILSDSTAWEVQRIQSEVITKGLRKKKSYNYKEEFKLRINEELGIGILKAEELQRNILMNLVLSTFICTGLRAGELRALIWSAVDLDSSRVKINKAFKSDKEEGLPKWNKTREIALPSILIERLRKWKEYTPFNEPSDYVFATVTGVPPGQTWIRKNLQKLIKETDEDSDFEFVIDDRWITPHAFRHTLNTHLLAGGVPPLLVQTYLGWSSDEQKILSRVQRSYTELRLFALEDVAKKIDDMYGNVKKIQQNIV